MSAEQQEESKSGNEQPAKAGKTRQPWWFNQAIPIDRFTGWLVAWTALLFVATIINAVILGITDHTLKGTLVETRKAADAATKSAQTQIDASDRQLRAYVFLDPQEALWDDKGLLGVTVVVKNAGVTPAYKVQTSGRVAVFDGINPTEEQLSALEFVMANAASPYVFPNAILGLSIFDSVSAEDIAKLKKPLTVVVLCVRVLYQDVFKKDRKSLVCTKAFGKEFAPYIPAKGKKGETFNVFWVHGYEEDD
jgi:hypothetical protein